MSSCLEQKTGSESIKEFQMTDKIPLSQSSSEGAPLHELDIYKCYMNSKYLSIKHSSYFQVYEDLLKKYRGRKITFVEIGVLNGGSLFMWRSFFGQQARIIGVDLDPCAKKWESGGFEICIGNQGDERFWDNFFSIFGDVDVVLDDGGHTNSQQIVTAHSTLPHIKDGGSLIVEDVHSSYLRDFGNPSRFSFVNYSKKLIDSINSRFPLVHASKNVLNKIVYSINFYESIVCFNVDRKKCFVGSSTSNRGQSSNAQDYRHHESRLNRIISKIKSFLVRRFRFLKKSGFEKYGSRKFRKIILPIASKLSSLKLKKFFC